MKRGMLLVVLLLSVMICMISRVCAKEYQGEIEWRDWSCLKIGDEEIHVRVDVDVWFKWKAWTLFSQPVEKSQIAFLVNPEVLITDRKTGRRYDDFPRELLGKLLFYNVRVLAGPDPRRKEKYSVLFNPGAVVKTYVGTMESFRALSEEQRSRYLSFNSPGSPSWDAFVSGIGTDSSQDVEKYHLMGPSARGRFEKGLTLDTLKVVRYSVDLTALKAWVLKQRVPSKKQLSVLAAEKKRALARLKREMERSLKAIESQSEAEYIDDFFETLENEYDPVAQVQVDYEKARRKTIAQYEKKRDLLYHKDSWEKLKKERFEIQAERGAGLRLVQGRHLPWEGDNLTVFSENIIGTGFRYGYKDKEKVVIPARYEEAKEFSEGLAFVTVDYKNKGYVNPQGRMVVHCSGFGGGGPFQDGLAAVSLGAGKWGFINKKGELVIDCEYNAVEPFAEGFAAVRKEGRWGFIDTRGNLIVGCKYRRVKAFSDGLAAVSAIDAKKRVSWGFINAKGEPVTGIEFRDVGKFHNGTAPVVISRHYEGRCKDRMEYRTAGKINRRGEMLGEPVERAFSSPEPCRKDEKP